MTRSLGFSCLLASFVMAWAVPSLAMDPRIQTIPYDPSNIVTLDATTGFAILVELSGDERIDNIVVGDSAGWQISPTKRGDRVVIKPSAGARATNMIVSTDARRYVFMLQPARDAGAAPFVVRFTYPLEV